MDRRCQIKIHTRGKPFGDVQEQLTEHTRTDGTVIFGPMKPGGYWTTLIDEKYDDMSVSRQIIIYGGKTREEVFLYPDMVETTARPAVTLPENLQKLNPAIYLYFYSRIKMRDGMIWGYRKRVRITGDGKF